MEKWDISVQWSCCGAASYGCQGPVSHSTPPHPGSRSTDQRQEGDGNELGTSQIYTVSSNFSVFNMWKM